MVTAVGSPPVRTVPLSLSLAELDVIQGALRERRDLLWPNGPEPTDTDDIRRWSVYVDAESNVIGARLKLRKQLGV